MADHAQTPPTTRNSFFLMFPSFKDYTPRTDPFPTFLLSSTPFRRSRQWSTLASSPSSYLPCSNTSPDLAPSSSSFTTSPTPRPTTPTYLSGHTSLLRCSRCATDLALTSQIISKGFTGRHGRAYLVSPTPSASSITPGPSPSPTPTTSTSSSACDSPPESLPNTRCSAPVARELVTGMHTVSDLVCVYCGVVLGWKYVEAEDEGQQYKVGKFILERGRVSTRMCWEGEGKAEEERLEAEVANETSLPKPSNARQDHPGEGKPQRETTIEFDSEDEDECEDLFAGVWSPELATRRRKAKAFGNGIGRIPERRAGEHPDRVA